MSRYENALEAVSGACNPVALANAFVRGYRELAGENGGSVGTETVKADPALRLIAYQLAYLMGTGELDQWAEWDRNIKACEAKRSENNSVTDVAK